MMFGAQRRGSGAGHVVAGEHRQHSVADQFQHVAALVMDGVDGSLRVIVEKGDDLVGGDGFADRGRAAQIGKPQHGVDALGDAAGDAAAQHLFGCIASEIDPAQRARDIHLGGGFDRKSQRRHQVAQRRKALLPKTVGPPRQPAGIDAIHLAQGSGFAEPMHEGEVVPVTLGGVVRDDRKTGRGGIGEIDAQLIVAVFQHVIEW